MTRTLNLSSHTVTYEVKDGVKIYSNIQPKQKINGRTTDSK